MSKKICRTEMEERSQHLLKLIVDRYIQDGQPIGSRTLSRESGLDLSPATIRNIMADLEDMGLIHSPHTSSGRIPTALGYRVFIDNLLKVKPLNKIEICRLRTQLTQEYEEQKLLEHTSILLSELTHLVGIVTLPRHTSKTLRHVEFLPLSKKRILSILVVNEQEVHNRIIPTTRHYSASELQQVANYLNSEFIGKDIKKVRKDLLNALKETRQNIDATMKTVIDVAGQAFDDCSENNEDLVISGQTNLMDVIELSNIDKLRELFAAFNQKQDILHLLDQTLKAQDMQIFIGEESGYKMLDECSIVTSPYVVNNQVIGVLGIIGPTRMAYESVIPIVNLTAKLLGAALR